MDSSRSTYISLGQVKELGYEHNDNEKAVA